VFEKIRGKGFQVLALHHAEAILTHDMPEAVKELESPLLKVQIPVEELIRGGGGEGELTQRVRRSLANDYGWKKHRFEIKKTVDGEEKESISHEIDHVKRFSTGTFALEIEWNKDPFLTVIWRTLNAYTQTVLFPSVPSSLEGLRFRHRFESWSPNSREEKV